MGATVQTLVATNKTAIDAGGLANKLAGGIVDGRIKCMLDSYTIDASEAAGSTIEIGGDLPKGAKVVAIILSASAAQTSLTIAVGDGASSTRYANAHTGLQTASATGCTIISGKNYVIGTATNDEYILITTAAATMTAGTLYAAILYTTD